MLPLSPSLSAPASAAELQAALEGGFTERGLRPQRVEVAAPSWPAIERLRVDLTGATAGRTLRWPLPDGPAGAALPVARLEIAATPLLLEGTPVQLRLEAEAVELRLFGGGSVLAPERSGPGRLAVEITRADLQQLALAAAQAAAAEHGAEVTDLQLSVSSEGERAVRVQAQATAKMSFFKAQLTLGGRAELDEELRLHLSELEVKGNGMAANLAAGLLRTRLEKAARQPIPLNVFQFGGVRLQRVRLSAGETVRAEAEFAS